MFEVDLPGSRVVFTTREGGYSDGPYSSLNLGPNTKDDPLTVARNQEKVAAELDVGELQFIHQVHGTEIAEARGQATDRRPIADGVTTTERGLPLVVLGADCPGVVISSASRTTALHCGWRSVAGGIVEHATRQSAGEGFSAAIGPGICQQHFEVGPEVVEAMGEDGERFADGRQLDLIGIIEARLLRAGAAHVHRVNRCTFCEPELLFSFRRDGETGRQGAVAWRI